MKTTLRLFLACVPVLSLVGSGMAQPVNDTCSGALPVVDGLNPVDNTNATLDTTVPFWCLRGTTNALSSGPDVWYVYTAPATGLRNFEVVSFGTDATGLQGNSSDTKLAMYDACDGTLLACDDDGGVGLFSKFWHVPVTAGTNYIIRFANSRFGTRGPGVLRIYEPPPPSPIPGDDCTNAVPVAGQPLAQSFDTTTFTTWGDTRGYECEGFRHDGWFAWTPSTTGIGVVNACGTVAMSDGNLSNFQLSIYDSCANPPLLCHNNPQDPPGGVCFPKMCLNVVAGHTYLVRFGVVFETEQANGTIQFEVRPPSAAYAPPADALVETGVCATTPADDLNHGCADVTLMGVTTSAFTLLNLCDTYTGTASARLQPVIVNLNPMTLSRDSDWYQFTLDHDDTITITGQSEFVPDASIVVSCPPTTIASTPVPGTGLTCAGAYSLNMTTGVLVAGTYAYRIAPQRNYGILPNSCGSGDRYWFHIEAGSAGCVGACCTGTSCSLASQSGCAGVFQGAGSACGAPNNPTTCCPANFDGMNGLQVADIFAFLNAWFAGSASADFDHSGALAVADIFAFLNAWFVSCP